MSRPNLFKLDTWGRHARAVLDVFRCALISLERQSDLPEGEVPLNRKLYFRAKEENYRRSREGISLTFTIIPDSPNLPIDENAESPARESKRPDFQCVLSDSHAGLELSFTVECKRLGHPPTSSHVLNRNYITEGVLRFKSPDHGYGEGASSGAMIGYVQSMQPDEILRDVNDYASEAKVEAVKKADAEWKERGVTKLNQELKRSVQPSPFTLDHMWLDLRHKYSK